ncbi:PD-(D/E)XK nuclease family protein [Halomonas salifodinae]|uniref:PD-(D/E)XK nuclease family protein n=1 Tax=Halomonas salifodinae TaxID=438745 RepID=A0ABW2EZ65_9GAMM
MSNQTSIQKESSAVLPEVFFQDFFQALDQMPVPETPVPNLFSAVGPGQDENRLSDLMAFFMGSHAGAPRWLVEALWVCLVRYHASAFGAEADAMLLPAVREETDWNDVVAEREVSVYSEISADVLQCTAKRLDFVIYDDRFVAGIEHKVWASAEHNPFGDYDRLIDSYQQEQKVRCVLRPNDDRRHVPDNWPVVSYQQLIDVAYELYGQQISRAEEEGYAKWQPFYQELLQHMQNIAKPKEAKTMEQHERDFSLRHFRQLREAVEYLNRLENELAEEGQAKVAEALGMAPADVSQSRNTWKDQTRVLRFFPVGWERATQVCLVYYPEVGESEADESIGFYVRAYIERADGYDLKAIEQAFLERIPAQKSTELVFYRDGGKDAAYESGGRFLFIDVWPREYTTAGAVAALGRLAAWVNEQVGGRRLSP